MPGENDSNSELMAEFEEFLSAKRAKEKEQQDSEDFDVEIWDKDGRGVRTKRSHAKPFLQTLGLDVDPEPAEKEPEKKEPAKRVVKPKGTESVTRKYFTNKK